MLEISDMKDNYIKLPTGRDARMALNKLGYFVQGDEDGFKAVLNMLYSLAVQIEQLKKEVHNNKEMLK